MNLVYINGEFGPKEDAKISIFDRGFLFADSVYEVVPAFGRKPFLMDEHIERLQRSCNELNFGPVPNDFNEIFEHLLKDTDIENLMFYIQVTRGQSKERNHIYNEGLQPNIVAFLQPLKPVFRDEAMRGFSAHLAPEPRWNRCDIKSTGLLPNVMHKTSAVNNQRIETIFFVGECITEATASNVFIVKNGVVKTPPDTENILRGITRNFLIEQLSKAGRPVEKTKISKSELIAADEVWVTSSTKNVIPIVKIDEQTIGAGKPGPVWSEAFSFFEKQFGW